jgi:hypothetical protein
LVEEGAELVEAAVDIADHVEGAVLLATVIPEGLPFDGGRLDLLEAVEHEDVPEALGLESTQRAPHLLGLLTDDVRAELPVGTAGVALVTDPLRRREDDCDG